MIIKTTVEQDRQLNEWYRKHVRAHHEEGLEPPGFTLQFELGLLLHYGNSVSAICGDDRLELGEVEVTHPQSPTKSR